MLYETNIKDQVIYGNEKLIEDVDKEILKLSLEHNLDTSAEHPVKDGDIVRHSSEKRRV